MNFRSEVVTLESTPVKLIDDIILLFRFANMNRYVQWMEKVKSRIVGKPYDEAAADINACYFGYGSLMDISIGFEGNALMREHRKFVNLREELYQWAIKHLEPHSSD